MDLTRTLSLIRKSFLIIMDIVTLIFAFLLSALMCQMSLFTLESLYSGILLVIIYSFMLSAFRSYNSLWRYAQPTEFLVFLLANLSGGFIYFLVNKQFIDGKLPVYYYALIISLSTLGTVGTRMAYRFFRSRSRAKHKGVSKRTLLVGAGAAALSLIVFSKEASKVEYLPVVAVDDDLTKLGKSIYGIKVVGTTDDIEAVCKKYSIDAILIAIPTATNKRRAEIIEKCMDTNCIVKTLPAAAIIAGEGVSHITEHIREITPEELLGRDPIEVANEKIYSITCGKTVLVTGGGGSIGSELCRQIAAHRPKKLIIFDIYENNLYEIEQELKRQYGTTLEVLSLVGSVREYEIIDEVMRRYKPDIVLHAAAHKHVPLMEQSPKEAVKNNIFGTRNVAIAAMQNNVSQFILISTDKAVNPTNIMGATKRVCEMIVQSLNGQSQTTFIAVRFGNVLGSNGSVIPLFKNQIQSGGPVTVTHPDIIRYFMTIPEAAQLVLTAGALANGGEIFVLDMGEPVKIDDLAKKMIKLAGLVLDKDISIQYSGLRPGEKLYEELLTKEEEIRKTENNKIFIGKQTEVDVIDLNRKLEGLKEIVYNVDSSDEEVEVALKNIIGTFNRNKACKKEVVTERKD